MAWATKVATPSVWGKSLKDGQRSWHEEVGEAVAKREASMAAGTWNEPEHRCTAMTTGTYGPKRQCVKSAIRGGTVCHIHGAGSKRARKAANRRILGAVDRTIDRMIEISEQNDHLPAAQRATEWLAKQALAPEKPEDEQKVTKSHVVNIGIAIGGIPDRYKPVIDAPTSTPVLITDGTVEPDRNS